MKLSCSFHKRSTYSTNKSSIKSPNQPDFRLSSLWVSLKPNHDQPVVISSYANFLRWLFSQVNLQRIKNGYCSHPQVIYMFGLLWQKLLISYMFFYKGPTYPTGYVTRQNTSMGFRTKFPFFQNCFTKWLSDSTFQSKSLLS